MTDIVKIGDATLYHGDCMEILPTLDKVDAVVTDPPYGINLKKKKNDYRQSKYFYNNESKKASVLYDDDPARIAELLKQAIPMALKISDRGLIFSGNAMLFNYPEPTAMGSVFTMAGAGRCSWGFQCTFPVLFYGKDPYLQDGKGCRPNSLKDDQPITEEIDHPCPKSIRWMNWAVDRASRIGEKIVDPFMGSGTTGVACANLGRKFIGIEIERKYFDIACERIDAAYSQGRLAL
jgi:DNA modification methylase